MRALVLSDESKAIAAKVVAYAEQHLVTWPMVQAMATGALPGVGTDANFTCVIPYGYRCCFSYEFQRVMKFRHLSVSVDGEKDRCPNEHAMHGIAKMFGFTDGIKGKDVVKIWIEKGHHPAVNVLEAMS